MDDLTSLLSPPSMPMTSVDPSVAPRISSAPVVDGKHTGVAGVARDILGTLGDFLLTRLHMPAMYAPAQHKRELSQALTGLDSDPNAAINRVNDVDPVFGAKLRDQYIDNQRLAAAQASTTESRDSRLALAQDATNTRTRGYAASMLGTMSDWDDAKRKQYYPQLRDQVLLAARRQGLDLSKELPNDYDPVALDAYIDGNVPVGRQRSQALTATRIQNQSDQAATRDATTNRGITVRADTAAAGQNNQAAIAGQRDTTTRRGQDLTAAGRTANTAATIAHHNATDGARANQLRDGDIRVVNGVQYVWNARTRQAEPVTTAK